MSNNENTPPETAACQEGPERRDHRVLVVGHAVAGCLVGELLGDRGFEVTVVPSGADTVGWTDELGPAAVRDRSTAAIDSNQLGVRVTFADGETVYYDLAVDTTGKQKTLDEQDRRHVSVTPRLTGESVTGTATTLATLVALVDALAGSRSVATALERYRRARRHV